MRLIFFWTIIVSISLAHGQSNDENTGISLNSDQQIKLSADKFIGYDLYNELYWVSKSTLYKRGTLGNFEFQELMLGPITHVEAGFEDADVSFPMINHSDWNTALIETFSADERNEYAGSIYHYQKK